MNQCVRKVNALCLFVGLSGFGLAVPAAAQAVAERPAWFEAAVNDAAAKGYPSLEAIPEVPTAKTDPAYWERLRIDLEAARLQFQASARAAPAAASSAADADAFRNRAIQDIENTRARY